MSFWDYILALNWVSESNLSSNIFVIPTYFPNSRTLSLWVVMFIKRFIFSRWFIEFICYILCSSLHSFTFLEFTISRRHLPTMVSTINMITFQMISNLSALVNITCINIFCIEPDVFNFYHRSVAWFKANAMTLCFNLIEARLPYG